MAISKEAIKKFVKDFDKELLVAFMDVIHESIGEKEMQEYLEMVKENEVAR